MDFNIFSKSNGDEEPQDLRMTDEQFREVLLDIDEIIGNVYEEDINYLVKSQN